MPVFALVGNKGGAGKTTLTMNLAAGLARRGSIAILDVDPQGSALQWRAIAEDDALPPVFDAGDDLIRQSEALENQYDFVLIDCPPSVHAPQTHAALRIIDMALIPVQPSPVDMWATMHTERAISNARQHNPSLQAMLVINQLEPRTTFSQLMREALAEIDIPLADTAIRRRAVYRNSALEGRSVYSMGKRGSDAAAELDELINEVIKS